MRNRELRMSRSRRKRHLRSMSKKKRIRREILMRMFTYLMIRMRLMPYWNLKISKRKEHCCNNHQLYLSCSSLLLMIVFLVHLSMEFDISPTTGINSVIDKVIFDKHFDTKENLSIMNVTTISQLEQSLEYLVRSLYEDSYYDSSKMNLVYYTDGTTNVIYTPAKNVSSGNSTNGTNDTTNTNTSNSTTTNTTNTTTANSTNTTNSSNSTNQQKIYAKFIGKYTYFAGMRFTTFSANIKNMSDEDTYKVMPMQREYAYDKVDPPRKKVNQTLPPYKYTDDDGYQEEGGFVMYFEANQSQTQARQKLQGMIGNNWFRNSMVETVVEVMFYNKNSQIGIIKIIKFFRSNTGDFLVSKEHNIFLPQNYINIFQSETIIKLILFTCFCLGIVFTFFKTLFLMFSKLKQMFKQKILAIEWYTYVDLVVVSCSIAYIAEWIKIFPLHLHDFELPISNEQFFKHWCQQSLLLKAFSRLGAVCVILIFIRNLRLLTTKFPAFGVLFDTIRMAKTDLVYFFILVFILVLSAMLLAIGFFGHQEYRFMNVNNTMMTLFQMIIGKFYFKSMERANPIFAPIFFYPYIIIFYYISMNFFSAIITRTYDNLRQRKQLVTEAMAEILARDTQKQKTKWINLICCRIEQPKPYDEDEDSDEDVKPPVTESFHGDAEDDDREHDPSIKARLLYNINQIKNMVRGNQFKTREQFEAQLHKAKKKIILRKRREIKVRKNRFKNSHDYQSYVKLKESVIFLIYIIVFVIMILYQTNNYSAQKVSEPVKLILTSQSINQNRKYNQTGGSVNTVFFADIQDSDDMFDFIKDVMFPFVYETKTITQQANIAVGNNSMRFTFRFVNNTQNMDAHTNTIFKGKHNSYSFGMNQRVNLKNYEEITLDYLKGEKINLQYSDVGGKDIKLSFNGNGGYEYMLSSNKTLAWEQFLKEIYSIDWLYFGLSVFVIDFVVYNPNYKRYVYSYVAFEIDGGGFVTPYIGTSSLYLNHFESTNAFVLTIELFYVLFTFYYTLRMLNKLRRTWLEITSLEPKQKLPRGTGRFGKVLLFIGIDYRQFEGKSFVQLIIIFRILVGVITFIIKQIIKLLKVILKQCLESMFGLIDIVQASLSIQIVANWIQIVIFPAFSLLPTGKEPELIFSANYLQDQQISYRTLLHFSAFIIFLRILQFFSFSKKLSAFTEILSSAAYDILFFVLMFAFIILGYSVAAHILYGSVLVEYRSTFMASLNLLRALMTDFNYSQMYEADSTMAAMFFVSYIVIFKIALLNMFIAIIVAHYNQFRRESLDEEHISFFTVIMNILRSNMFKDRPEDGDKFMFFFKKPKWCYTDKWNTWLFGNYKEKQKKKDEAIAQQQQEAENIQAIMGERLQAPTFNDYHLQLGMKSYFQLDEQDLNNKKMKQEFMKGVRIFKRTEEKGYEVQDLNNANFWLFNLEENLLKLTSSKVSIYDFHNDQGIYSNLLESLDPEKLTKTQQEFLMIDPSDKSKRLKFFIQKSTRIYQKYDIWKAMDFERLAHQLSLDDDDEIVRFVKFLAGIVKVDDLKEEENMQNIQFKSMLNSKFFTQKFNKCSKMQLHIWKKILTNEEKYLLWFEIFTAYDRNRLWNRLVFSEDYFRFVGFTPRFTRYDVRHELQMLQNKIQEKVDRKIRKNGGRAQADESKQSKKAKERRNRNKFSQFQQQSQLPREEQLDIRDKYYTTKVMLKLWNMTKKRSFEIPNPEPRRPRNRRNAEKKKIMTVSKKNYLDMLHQMFRIMVKGLANDRNKMFHNVNPDEESRFKIYKKLKEDIFDDTEYRLPLWLPLSIEEKLDMILHQRVEEEMELMLFLLDQEYDLSKNIGNSDKFDILVERSLDTQIFEKYLNSARFQAIKRSVELCNKRLKEVEDEDRQLIEYAAFLHQKINDYDSLLTQMKAEVQQRRKQNERIERDINEANMELEREKENTRRKRQASRNSNDSSDNHHTYSRRQSMHRGGKSVVTKSSIRKRNRQRWPGAGSIRSGQRESINQMNASQRSQSQINEENSIDMELMSDISSIQEKDDHHDDDLSDAGYQGENPIDSAAISSPDPKYINQTTISQKKLRFQKDSKKGGKHVVDDGWSDEDENQDGGKQVEESDDMQQKKASPNRRRNMFANIDIGRLSKNNMILRKFE